MPELETLIFLHRQLLLVSPKSVDKLDLLERLIQILEDQFRRTSRLTFLEEAIGLCRDIHELCPPSHSRRLQSLIRLADSLSRHFDQTGQIADLAEAITLCREALDLLPHAHPQFLPINLAFALLKRLHQTGQVVDWEEAAVLGHKALELCPPSHPRRSYSLNERAFGLGRHFSQRSPAVGLERQFREVLVTPVSSPCRPRVPGTLFQLGLGLQVSLV
jgi:tetratricopeptide (TPR) repeat protein